MVEIGVESDGVGVGDVTAGVTMVVVVVVESPDGVGLLVIGMVELEAGAAEGSTGEVVPVEGLGGGDVDKVGLALTVVDMVEVVLVEVEDGTVMVVVVVVVEDGEVVVEVPEVDVGEVVMEEAVVVVVVVEVVVVGIVVEVVEWVV